MASSSNSFSEEELNEISEIQEFIVSESFDIDDTDFGESSKESELGLHQKQVSELENRFNVKLSPDGRSKLTNLIAYFQNDNDAEKVATAFAKWSDDVASLFLGLQKVEAASVLLDILQEIAKSNKATISKSFDIQCNDFDLGVLTYIGGYLLNKVRKKGHEDWKVVINLCSKLPDYDILDPKYNYLNFMNEKYDGRLDLIPSDIFGDFLVSGYLVILRYCQQV